MKAGVDGYRIATLAGIALLIALLAVTVTNLLTQLDDLSVAEDDNTLWSLSQLDTEFANLEATLSRQRSETLEAAQTSAQPQPQAQPPLTDAAIRLRLDIALSRMGIITSGRAALLFADTAEAAPLLAALQTFSDRAITIADSPGELTPDNLQALRQMTRDIRPTARKIALLGVERSASIAEAHRQELSRLMTRTGGIAIVLLVLMAGLLLLLDRLLHRAARRDAELLTSSQLLKSTVAASLDAIVTANAAGEIIEFNTAAEQTFGWRRDEIIGKTMEQTFIPDHMRQAHRDGMARFLATGKPRVVDGGRVELSALRKSGEEFPVELNITSIKDPDGTKFIAYLRDISARKISEQTLIDARDRAERTDRAKSQFLTVMSHEMRTPLNGILGVLDLLKTTPLSQQQARYANIATASSEILLEHVNEALDITRVETGTLQLTPVDFDLAAMMRSITDTLSPLAQEKNLELSLKIDAAMRVTFHADSNRIRQILTNLIGNAIKFTDKGSVRLRVGGIHGPEVTSLKVTVQDTGAGIDPAHQEQIFEDFVALAHSEGRQSRGDGLGLSISRKIARQLGGDITVSSDIGIGSTFTLTVPVLRRNPATPEAQAQTAGQDALPGRQCHILVVEDNAINRKVLDDMLTGMGHVVSQAVTGLDCLEQAAQTEFDLILMDISMPEMDGIEATRRLRATPGPNAHVHISGLTAHGHEEYRDEARAAGMNSFHTKPIRLDSLRRIISDVAPASARAVFAPPIDDAEAVSANPAENEALRDLCAVLGPDKVLATGDRFFAELAAYLDSLRDGQSPPAPAAIAEGAHKNKGAAVMLGLRALEADLAHIEHQARAKDATTAQTLAALSDTIESLEQQAAKEQAAFRSLVENQPG